MLSAGSWLYKQPIKMQPPPNVSRRHHLDIKTPTCYSLTKPCCLLSITTSGFDSQSEFHFPQKICICQTLWFLYPVSLTSNYMWRLLGTNLIGLVGYHGNLDYTLTPPFICQRGVNKGGDLFLSSDWTDMLKTLQYSATSPLSVI